MSYQREVREMRPAGDVREADVMTLTEAAGELGLSMSAMGDLVYRGVLTRLVDQDERNPTKANRVLRSEVAAEKARRRSRRRDDSRLKRPVRA